MEIDYVPSRGYDEMREANGAVRDQYALLAERLKGLSPDDFEHRRRIVALLLRNQGVTFTVYQDDAGVEKVFPFDPIPRVIDEATWSHVERGLVQRVEALNLFLRDIYGEQKILRDRVVDPALVFGATFFRREMVGCKPARGIYVHVVGTDLIRDDRGDFCVLEDNVRNPSGVSYVLQSRAVLKRVFPTLFNKYGVRPVDDYGDRLREALRHVAPRGGVEPKIVVLTPGIYNSAYFEHSFLARQMGVELVEGRDLVVHEGAVCTRSTNGLERVDVIYRRIDDDFIDPIVFRPDSSLGCPGLFSAYRSGAVSIANAPGTGVGDDKAIYPYLPDIIRYYLDADPVLPNIETFVLARDADRKHVVDNLEKLVVKRTDGAGGYGMLIGPASTAEEREEFRRRIEAEPRSYIAQPTIQLGSHPTLVDGRLEPRCVDLRPFVLFGDRIRVVPGGLTRVALRKGSLVVNSSQGGGYKDTWVLQKGAERGGAAC